MSAITPRAAEVMERLLEKMTAETTTNNL
jgi:hypothetical protein